MLDNPLAEVLPASMCFGIIRRTGRRRRENARCPQMGPELLGNNRPSHKFGDGEEFQQLGFKRDQAVAVVAVYAMQKIGLFVVVRREDDIINYSLKGLMDVSHTRTEGISKDLTARNCSGLSSTDSVSRTCR